MSYVMQGRRAFGAGDECDGVDDGGSCGSNMHCEGGGCICDSGTVVDPNSGACIYPSGLCDSNQYWSSAAGQCMDNPTAEAGGPAVTKKAVVVVKNTPMVSAAPKGSFLASLFANKTGLWIAAGIAVGILGLMMASKPRHERQYAKNRRRSKRYSKNAKKRYGKRMPPLEWQKLSVVRRLELAHMGRMLHAAGYHKHHADALFMEGMGTEELHERLKERGGLARTHGLPKRMTKNGRKSVATSKRQRAVRKMVFSGLRGQLRGPGRKVGLKLGSLTKTDLRLLLSDKDLSPQYATAVQKELNARGYARNGFRVRGPAGEALGGFTTYSEANTYGKRKYGHRQYVVEFE